MPDRASLRNRLRYRFDNLLARGIWAVLVWLGAITFLAVLLSAVALAVFDVSLSGSEDGSVLEDFWQSLLRILDTGTMAADVGWGRRLLALAMTVFGLLVAGALIGFMASGVEDRIERMRRGRSVVIESDHFVVLGSSERLPIVVQQLMLAGGGRSGNAIVVLAETDPTEISDEVRRAVGNSRGSRLVVRYGDPTLRADLGIVALGRARAVIVLGGEGDSRAVKAVLAVGAELGGFDRIPVIVELDDPTTADGLVRACGGAVHPVVPAQAVARTAAFALREPGLARVVNELLDFRGCSVRFRDPTDLAGLTFGEIVVRYAKARPIGRTRTNGDVEINPGPDVRFEAGDQLIVIADAGEELEIAEAGSYGPVTRSTTEPPPASVDEPDQVLVIIGWNDLGTHLVGHWEAFAPSGSTAEIIVDERTHGADLPTSAIAGGDGLTVTRASSISDLWGPETARPRPTTVMLLADRGTGTADETDSRNLLNLLLLRREFASWDGHPPRVIVELLDVDNVELAGVSGDDDYLVSQAIASRFIAQLADQPARRPVFLALYAADRPSVRLVPGERLGLVDEVSAAEIITAAFRAGMIAIGWRRSTHDGVDVVLNPHHADRVRLGTGDQIVVVA